MTATETWREVGTSDGPTATLARLWWRNWRIGWPERVRGLHYWLGFEYALATPLLQAKPGELWLDVGTGAWSVLPYLLADLRGVTVIALDVDDGVARQLDRRARAAAAGLCRPDSVHILRGDARALPFADASFDGVTAISTIEHVDGLHGDRQALADIARVLRSGGRAVITVPFRDEGSAIEMDAELDLYQRHYSARTLETSLLGPSRLIELTRILYGERLPFYRLSTRLPAWLHWLVRPWDSLLSAALLRRVDDPATASAVLCELEKSRKADIHDRQTRHGVP